MSKQRSSFALNLTALNGLENRQLLSGAGSDFGIDQPDASPIFGFLSKSILNSETQDFESTEIRFGDSPANHSGLLLFGRPMTEFDTAVISPGPLVKIINPLTPWAPAPSTSLNPSGLGGNSGDDSAEIHMIMDKSQPQLMPRPRMVSQDPDQNPAKLRPVPNPFSVINAISKNPVGPELPSNYLQMDSANDLKHGTEIISGVPPDVTQPNRFRDEIVGNSTWSTEDASATQPGGAPVDQNRPLALSPYESMKWWFSRRSQSQTGSNSFTAEATGKDSSTSQESETDLRRGVLSKWPTNISNNFDYGSFMTSDEGQSVFEPELLGEAALDDKSAMIQNVIDSILAELSPVGWSVDGSAQSRISELVVAGGIVALMIEIVRRKQQFESIDEKSDFENKMNQDLSFKPESPDNNQIS